VCVREQDLDTTINFMVSFLIFLQITTNKQTGDQM